MRVTSFVELEKWLRDIPGQMTGIPCAVCQTGEEYVEFMEYALARPADANVIEAWVADRMLSRLESYFAGRGGMIYWRTALEHTVTPAETVVRFDETGTEVDFITNRKCVKDHDWVRVACYCRLYRARYAFAGFDFVVTPTAVAA